MKFIINEIQNEIDNISELENNLYELYFHVHNSKIRKHLVMYRLIMLNSDKLQLISLLKNLNNI